LTLEESKGMQKFQLSRFSRVAEEHEQLSRSHMSHSRELDKISLALQRVDREHAELKKLFASRVNGLDALGQRQSVLEEGHGVLQAALSGGPNAQRGSLAERVATLETTLQAESAELHGAIDKMHRSLLERVAALELLLEVGVPSPANAGTSGTPRAEDNTPQTYALPSRTLTLTCSPKDAPETTGV